MGSLLVVFVAPGLGGFPGFSKSHRFSQLSRKTPLKLSLWPFCQGLLGAMNLAPISQKGQLRDWTHFPSSGVKTRLIREGLCAQGLETAAMTADGHRPAIEGPASLLESRSRLPQGAPSQGAA